jgi:hypothetical protein
MACWAANISQGPLTESGLVMGFGRLTPAMHEKHSSSHQTCAHELSSGMGIGLRHTKTRSEIWR